MFYQVRRTVGFLVSLLLAFTLLVATESPSQADLNAKSFDPGNIISDSVFFNWASMDANQIQEFLDARISGKCSNGYGEKCLKEYREDVVGSYKLRGMLHDYQYQICKTVPPSSNQTAAEIIYQVAVACGINPKVFLVTLQKEQGLITSESPTSYKYRAAMGYACPDSDPAACGKDAYTTSRLFYQLYRAAWQMRWYGDPRGSFTYYRPGTVIDMRWAPDSCGARNSSGKCIKWVNKCGWDSFKLQSQATANLYYYTPYSPNKAALDNLWGTGDSCSAYGNRNFWRQFWTWFGSPVAGSYLIRYKDDKGKLSPVFLVNQKTNKKYQISYSLIPDYKPLGPVGTVEGSKYLDSFTTSGTAGNLVSDESGARYYLASGLKYKIADSATATKLGLSWTTATALNDAQISSFESFSLAKAPDVDQVYLLQGSTKNPVSKTVLPSLSALGEVATVSAAVLEKFDTGADLDGLVQDETTLAKFNIVDGKKITIYTQAQATAMGLDWNSPAVVKSDILNDLPTAAFVRAGSNADTYLLADDGRIRLASAAVFQNIQKFGSVANVSKAYLSDFSVGPKVSNHLQSGGVDWYLTKAGQRIRVNNSSQGAALSLSTSIVKVTSSQLKTLKAPVLMKTDSATNYLVTGYEKKFPISSGAMSCFSQLGEAITVPAAYLATLATQINPDRLVTNSTVTKYYFLRGKSRYEVKSKYVAYALAPKSFSSVTQEWSTLPALTDSQLAAYTEPSPGVPVSKYLKGENAYYYLANGQLHEVLDNVSLLETINKTVMPPVSSTPAKLLSYLPLAAPYISDKSVLTNSDTGEVSLYVGGKIHAIATSLFADVKTSSAWHFRVSNGNLFNASLSMVPKGANITPFVLAGGTGYLLGKAGKQPFTDITSVVANPTELPAAVTALIDLTTKPAIATPFLIEDKTKSVSYLVSGKTKRQLGKGATVAKLSPLVAGGSVGPWPSYVIESIATGNLVVTPSQIVKVKESGNIYLIDGWSKGLRISEATAKAFTTSKPRAVTRADLKGYNTQSTLGWQKVICGTSTYLVDSGKLFVLDQATANQWPGTAQVLHPKTCSKLVITTTATGVFIANDTQKNKYQIIGGKLKPIRTEAEYASMSTGKTPAVVVSDSLIAGLPKLNPTSYVVVAKDTLLKVASKFKTTTTKLRKLNHLTTDVLRRGQVLVLP